MMIGEHAGCLTQPEYIIPNDINYTTPSLIYFLRQQVRMRKKEQFFLQKTLKSSTWRYIIIRVSVLLPFDYQYMYVCECVLVFKPFVCVYV